jgi:hypothetical protein
VTDAPPKPEWRTGVLWGILAVFLVIGTVGAATAVYGVMALASGDPFGLIPLAVGAVVALLGFLFIAGILYRVDRYRGANLRRLELFE